MLCIVHHTHTRIILRTICAQCKCVSSSLIRTPLCIFEYSICYTRVHGSNNAVIRILLINHCEFACVVVVGNNNTLLRIVTSNFEIKLRA